MCYLLDASDELNNQDIVEDNLQLRV